MSMIVDSLNNFMWVIVTSLWPRRTHSAWGMLLAMVWLPVLLIQRSE